MSEINKLAKSGFDIVHVPISHFFNPYPSSYYIVKTENTEADQMIEKKNNYNENIKFDFTIMCKVLLGKKLEKILNFLIVANNLVFLIGCSSSFAASMASLIAIGPLDTCDIFEENSFLQSCRYKYIFFIVVFSLIVGPMTLLFHFTESTFYLICVAFSRILVILFMAGTAIWAYVTSTSLTSADYLDHTSVPFNVSSFGLSVPIIFLTMGFHLLIPDVYQALKDKRKNAGNLIIYSFSIAFSLIVLLSLSMALGCEEVKQLATLNWSGFTMGYSMESRPYWTIILEFLISIYPCIDVTSIFSMTAVNVADNILALQFHGLDDFVVEPDKVFYMRSWILIISLWFSVYFYDLGIVFALAGSINIVFLFLFVIMFGIASIVIVPGKKEFDNFLAHRKFLLWLLIGSLLFLIGMWGSFIRYLILE